MYTLTWINPHEALIGCGGFDLLLKQESYYSIQYGVDKSGTVWEHRYRWYVVLDAPIFMDSDYFTHGVYDFATEVHYFIGELEDPDNDYLLPTIKATIHDYYYKRAA